MRGLLPLLLGPIMLGGLVRADDSPQAITWEKCVRLATLSNPDLVPDQVPDFMRSGMTAGLTFIRAEHDHVLLVPALAIMSQGILPARA